MEKKEKSKVNNILILKKITICAFLVALAIILEIVSDLTGLQMSEGGSFLGLELIPLLLIGYLFGFSYSFLSCLAFGVLQTLMSRYIVGVSFLLDYLFAYLACSITSIAKNKLNNVPLIVITTLLAGLIKFVSHFLAGVIFWIPSDLEGGALLPIIWYSFSYNILYVLSSTILATVTLILTRKRLSLVFNHFGLTNINLNPEKTVSENSN
jgi:thiamine transporter